MNVSRGDFMKALQHYSALGLFFAVYLSGCYLITGSFLVAPSQPGSSDPTPTEVPIVAQLSEVPNIADKKHSIIARENAKQHVLSVPAPELETVTETPVVEAPEIGTPPTPTPETPTPPSNPSIIDKLPASVTALLQKQQNSIQALLNKL